MPRPMQPTRRFAALALASAVLLGACTGGEGDPGGTAGTGETGSVDTGPTPAETLTPGQGVYTYQNAGLTVTLTVEGASATLNVDNGTEHDLDPPGLYVLDAVDGHQIDLEVTEAAPIPAGESAGFDVTLGDVSLEQIGLLVLLFGQDNYGAFVRTA